MIWGHLHLGKVKGHSKLVVRRQLLSGEGVLFSGYMACKAEAVM